jgi:hypothetical protein
MNKQLYNANGARHVHCSNRMCHGHSIIIQFNNKKQYHNDDKKSK